jgi:hypothetical protein
LEKDVKTKPNMRFLSHNRRQDNLTASTPRHKLVIVMCKKLTEIKDLDVQKKMSSLGGPTFKKKNTFQKIHYTFSTIDIQQNGPDGHTFITSLFLCSKLESIIDPKVVYNRMS